MTPQNTPANRATQKWRENHPEDYRQSRRRRQAKLRGIIKRDTSHKAVMVEYPGVAVPDWYSKSEYARIQNAFEPGDKIYVDGVLQPQQLTFKDAQNGR